MHDINPQGPMMHLKELERQASLVSRRRSLPPIPGRKASDFGRLLKGFLRDFLTHKAARFGRKASASS